MIDITKIDENFAVKTKVGRKDLCYYDAESSPFKIENWIVIIGIWAFPEVQRVRRQSAIGSSS